MSETEGLSNEFKGIYMTVVLLEDRMEVRMNDGYLSKNRAASDVVMYEDIDFDNIEKVTPRSAIAQGCLTIPFKDKKIRFQYACKGNLKALVIWYKKKTEEDFARMYEMLASHKS
ncbi:MAG: hypothetical protein AB9844_12540 [Clostridiaceae bacterium]